jgi:hypothetical protein
MLLSMLCLFAVPAFSAPNTDRVDTLLQYHTTVDTAAALAIPVVNVGAQLRGWRFCADAGNTNTVALGQLADLSDGMVLAAGACFVCDKCTTPTLKAMQVKGGAAAQGYSFVQFR